MAATPTAHDHPRMPAAWMVAACMLISVSEGFDLATVGLAGPGMIRDLALTRSEFGLTATVMMAGFFVGSASGGILGDRFGRRRLVIIGLAIVSVFSFLTSQAQDLGGLVLVRFLTGLGVGAVFPNLITLAAASVPAGARGRAITLTNCGGSIGGLAGAALLAFGGPDLSWRTFFLIGAIAPLLIIPVTIWVLPRDIKLDPRSVALPKPTYVLFGEGRTLLTTALWVANFLTAFMFYMITNWAPALLAERGLGTATLGAANAALSVSAMIGALSLAFLLDKRQRRLPFFLAYGGMLIAFAAFAFAGTSVMAIASMALIGLTVMGGLLLLYAITPMLYPDAGKSTGMGWAVAIGRIGAVVSPWAVGLALDSGLGQRDLVWVMAPAIVVAGLAGLLAVSLGAKTLPPAGSQ